MSKSFDAFNSSHSQQCDQDHLLVENHEKFIREFRRHYQRREVMTFRNWLRVVGDMIDELDWPDGLDDSLVMLWRSLDWRLIDWCVIDQRLTHHTNQGRFEVTESSCKNFVSDAAWLMTPILLRNRSVYAGFYWENETPNEFTDSKWSGELTKKRGLLPQIDLCHSKSGRGLFL